MSFRSNSVKAAKKSLLQSLFLSDLRLVARMLGLLHLNGKELEGSIGTEERNKCLSPFIP
jgi:hypothetical protein